MLVVLFCILQACSDTETAPHFVQAELDAWVHYGTEAERRTIQQQVARFNDLQDKVRINAVILPEGIYHQQIETAAAAGRLPDILEVNPVYVGYQAWSDYLRPIDKLLTDSIRNDLLSALVQQNMLQGRLYAVSPNSRVIILYARRSALKRAGIVLDDTLTEPWSMITGVVEQLSRYRSRQQHSRRPAENGNPVILELHPRSDEHWLSETLWPLVQASGGTLGDQPPYIAKLDAPATVHLLHQLQDWFSHGNISSNKDDAFSNGRAPLVLATQAEFDHYLELWKDDLLVLPLVFDGADAGLSQTGLQAGWSWGISRDCRDLRTAMHFIEFLLQPEEILMMADASVTLPATHSALQMSNHFRRDETPVFDATLMDRAVLSRSGSPAYPQLRSRFDQLLQNIAGGADVSAEVGRAMTDMTLIIDQYKEASATEVQAIAPLPLNDT
jgi:multiple sugar transport system substrate-binding protein